jgi:hypothetical protein
MASRCKRRLASYGNQLLRRDFLRPPDPSFNMVLAHSPITTLPTDRKHAYQMMPLAAATCFNDIGRELVGATMEFGKFLIVSDDLAMSRQTCTKEISHENNIGDLTNGTLRFGLLADSAGCPHEFGVRITHFFTTQTAAVILINEVTASHAVIN